MTQPSSDSRDVRRILVYLHGSTPAMSAMSTSSARRSTICSGGPAEAITTAGEAPIPVERLTIVPANEAS